MRRENDFTNVRKFGCISEFIEINHNRFFISIINYWHNVKELLLLFLI